MTLPKILLQIEIYPLVLFLTQFKWKTQHENIKEFPKNLITVFKIFSCFSNLLNYWRTEIFKLFCVIITPKILLFHSILNSVWNLFQFICKILLLDYTKISSFRITRLSLFLKKSMKYCFANLLYIFPVMILLLGCTEMSSTLSTPLSKTKRNTSVAKANST